MQQLKLAYEWIGPTGPVSNNDYPSLYDLKRQYNYDHTEEYGYPTRTANLKELLNDVYDIEVTPVSNIKNQDFFLYEINIDYKHKFIFDSFFSHHITTRIKNLLNSDAGRGYYAFNACLEGWCDDHFFHTLYNLINKNQINPKKVIYFTGSTNGQALHDIWAKNRGITNTITVVSCNHYCRMQKQRINSKRSRDKKFICLNRRWKPHRLLLYVYLHKNRLLDNFYFSMPNESITSPGESFHNIVHGLVSRYALDINTNDINAAFNDLPMVLDNKDFVKVNWWEASNLSEYHANSYVSIVTETMFGEPEIFPTEKIFRPMSYAQPFIAISAPGYLDGLRSMGFQTFSNQIDESYDCINSHTRRLNELFRLVTEMCSWPESKFEDLVNNTQTQCLHNYHMVTTNKPRLITVEQMSKLYDNR